MPLPIKFISPIITQQTLKNNYSTLTVSKYLVIKHKEMLAREGYGLSLSPLGIQIANSIIRNFDIDVSFSKPISNYAILM